MLLLINWVHICVGWLTGGPLTWWSWVRSQSFDTTQSPNLMLGDRLPTPVEGPVGSLLWRRCCFRRTVIVDKTMYTTHICYTTIYYM